MTGNDGRLYLLDGASLGGADHKTPLHVTAKYTAAGAAALATWEDDGTRWIVAPRPARHAAGREVHRERPAPPNGGSVVAFQAGGPGRQAVARARLGVARPDVAARADRRQRHGHSPRRAANSAAASRAADRGAARAQRRRPRCSTRSTAPPAKSVEQRHDDHLVRARGLSAGGGQVYLVTYDNTLYAFGIPMEH